MADEQQLTEQQFNTVVQRVMQSAPDGLDEAGFQSLLDREVLKEETAAKPWYQRGINDLQTVRDLRGAGMGNMIDSAASGGIGANSIVDVARKPVAGVLQRVARKLYGGLLKPTKAVRKEFGDVVPELLDSRRMITRGGAEAAEEAVSASAGVADDMIANAPRPSKGVSPLRVSKEFRPVLDAVKARVDAGVVPASELDKVVDRVQRLRQSASQSGGRFDPQRAQALKRTSQEAATGAYKQMQAGGSKMLSTDDLLDAATARGFKGGIEDIVPGIGQQNAATQRLIGQSRAMADAVGRTGNHLPFGSVSDLAAMGVGTANPLLGIMGKAATMAGPGSAMAIGLNEAGKSNALEALTRAAIIAMMKNHE